MWAIILRLIRHLSCSPTTLILSSQGRWRYTAGEYSADLRRRPSGRVFLTLNCSWNFTGILCLVVTFGLHWVQDIIWWPFPLVNVLSHFLYFTRLPRRVVWILYLQSWRSIGWLKFTDRRPGAQTSLLHMISPRAWSMVISLRDLPW